MERDTGQTVPLIAVLAVLAGLAALGLGRLGADAVDRARARTAADAAALAGAVHGERAAAEVAKANGGRLDDFDGSGGDTRVEVSVDGHTAVATARLVRSAPTPHNLPVTTTEGGG